MTDKMLELCRAVKYTPNPNGRKGSRKCGECGFFFVPDGVVYSFDHPAWFVDTEHHTGREWYETTSCCPNCWPKGPGLVLGGRRCLGQRRKYRGWRQLSGCGEWFSVLTKGKLRDERRKRNRAQICPGCSQDNGIASKFDWQATRGYIRAWAAELGRAPTLCEWKNERSQDVPGKSAINCCFGTYNNFVTWCGLKARGPGQNVTRSAGRFKRQFSSYKLIKLMREMGDEYGRALSVVEWNTLELGVSAGAVQRRFADEGRRNGWSKAWLRVGYKPFPDCSEGTPGAKAFLAEMTERSRRKAERLQRELDERTALELNKMLAAHRRFEDAKFRSANA